jgi:hypothetical protein
MPSIIAYFAAAQVFKNFDNTAKQAVPARGSL